MDEDKWLTLHDDLLVDIFRRLDALAVIRCAAACRPWRRAVIDNASCLGPRTAGCFLPDLPLGFLDRHARLPRRLQYVPDPAVSNAEVPPSLLTPATDVGVCIDGTLYNNLLSSRDGLLLLGENTGHESLCLCAAMTGACKVLPPAPLFDTDPVSAMYVLATGYDVDDKPAAVWILAVKWMWDSTDGMTYQIFSFSSGAGSTWGPIKTSSANLPEDMAYINTKLSSSNGAVVDSRGAVSWFVNLFPHLDLDAQTTRKCIFSVELRTGRAWTTMELPPDLSTEVSSLALAVSEDGRLSLVKMLSSSHQMEVWVLADGDGDGGQWTLRRKIDDVQKLLPSCASMGHMWLSGFCPRSGYLFGVGWDRDDRNLRSHFVVGVDGRSARLMGRVESGNNGAHRFPYEMDSSTYISSCISKMKYIPSKKKMKYF